MDEQDWVLVRLKQNQVKLAADALTDLESPAAREAAQLLQTGPTVVGRFRLRSEHVETLLEVLAEYPVSSLLKATTKRLRQALPLEPARAGSEPEDRQHKLTNDAALGRERKRARHFTGGEKREH